MTFEQQLWLATIPVLSAVAAVLITQWWADRRANADRAHMTGLQESDWRGQRRTEAHMAFLARAREISWEVGWEFRDEESDVLSGTFPTEVVRQWHNDMALLLVPVEVFGSAEAATAARKVAGDVDDVEHHMGALMSLDLDLEKYRRAVQRDLGVATTRLATNWASATLDDMEAHGDEDPWS